eukprot:6351563-Alexandrium_andersonii.AAC.1
MRSCTSLRKPWLGPGARPRGRLRRLQGTCARQRAIERPTQALGPIPGHRLFACLGLRRGNCSGLLVERRPHSIA